MFGGRPEIVRVSWLFNRSRLAAARQPTKIHPFLLNRLLGGTLSEPTITDNSAYRINDYRDTFTSRPTKDPTTGFIDITLPRFGDRPLDILRFCEKYQLVLKEEGYKKRSGVIDLR